MENILKKIGLLTFAIIIIIYIIPIITYLYSTIKFVRYIFTEKVVIQALFVSLKSSLLSMLIVFLIGIPGVLYVWKSKSNTIKSVYSFTDMPLVIPPSVAGLILLITFGRMGIIGKYLNIFGIQISFTIAAVCLAQIFVAGPIFFKSYKTGLENLDPDLIKTGEILGLSEFKVFVKIILPLCSNSIVSGMIMSFSRMLAEFGATIMFAGNLRGITQTLPLAIFSTMETDINLSLAIGLFLIIISFVVHFTSKFFIKKVY